MQSIFPWQNKSELTLKSPPATRLRMYTHRRLISDSSTTDLQFNGFVPIDDISGEGEGVHIDKVRIAAFSANVQPFTLKRQAGKGDPEINKN